MEILLLSKKGARQGDPISTYLFIIIIEVLFALIKNKVYTKGIDLYDHSSLFTDYIDDLTFFRKDISSVTILVETCSLKTVDLTNDAIKMLAIHFSLHNETKTEHNFLNTVKKYRRLSMYGIQENLL